MKGTESHTVGARGMHRISAVGWYDCTKTEDARVDRWPCEVGRDAGTETGDARVEE